MARNRLMAGFIISLTTALSEPFRCSFFPASMKERFTTLFFTNKATGTVKNRASFVRVSDSFTI